MQSNRPELAAFASPVSGVARYAIGKGSGRAEENALRGLSRDYAMKRLMLLSAAFALSATMAMAAISASDLVTAYQSEGYTKIEVVTGLTQIRVEATKGTAKIEVIYDAATGAILSQEQGKAKRSDRGTGVVLSTSTHDFLNSVGEDDHGTMGEDAGDDHGEMGDDDGPNHDANDDHGGEDEGGNDDSDHHGSDDEGGNEDGDHHGSTSGHGRGGNDD